MNETVTFAQLSWVAGAVVTVGMIVTSVMLWLWRQFSAQKESFNQQILGLNSIITSLRIEMAQRYVTTDALMQVEKRLAETIHNMTGQFEKGFERLIDMMGLRSQGTRRRNNDDGKQ